MSSDATRRTIARIEHLALHTHDLERLRAFYEQQLGAEASAPSEDADTGLPTCVLDFCGIRLELLELPRGIASAAGNGQAAGFARIGFALGSADAVDELTARLAAAGHEVIEPPRRTCVEGCYESLVLDPDGNRLKLTV